MTATTAYTKNLTVPGLDAGTVENAFAGIFDTLTFDLTKTVRGWLGGDNINYCSTAYQAGGGIGLAFGMLIPGEDEALAADEGLGDAATTAVGIHGNSASSPATAYLYRLTNSRTGEYLKTGISKDPFSRYTSTFMQDREMEILTSGSRREMLNLERFIVERDAGSLNREPWAGRYANDTPGAP